MWFDGVRQPNTLYVANTSRGKDSTAMLRAIQLMGWPLDMIVSVDIWATQDIPAELPPMVAFKDEYDRKVLDWFGVPVTRLCATKRERERAATQENVTHDCHTKICSTGNLKKESLQEQSKDFPSSEVPGANTLKPRKLTYEDIFYRKVSPKRERERDGRPGDRTIYGFPQMGGIWCNSDLKRAATASQSVLSEIGVPRSRDPHQRLSVDKRSVVPGQTQREHTRRPFPMSPGTRGRK